jgi:hypothetical protein
MATSSHNHNSQFQFQAVASPEHGQPMTRQARAQTSPWLDQPMEDPVVAASIPLGGTAHRRPRLWLAQPMASPPLNRQNP